MGVSAKISLALGFGPTDQPVSLPWKFGLPLSQLDACFCQGCPPGRGGSTAMTTGATGPAMMGRQGTRSDPKGSASTLLPVSL